MRRPLPWCILLAFAWAPVPFLGLRWWINLYEFFEGDLQALVQQFDSFQPYTSLAMPEVPALLSTETSPMRQLSDGMNIMALK